MILPAEGDFRLDNEAATARLGAAVGKVLEAGEAVCLWGPLGAGKTCLARGLIRSLGDPREDVPSAEAYALLDKLTELVPEVRAALPAEAEVETAIMRLDVNKEKKPIYRTGVRMGITLPWGLDDIEVYQLAEPLAAEETETEGDS